MAWKVGALNMHTSLRRDQFSSSGGVGTFGKCACLLTSPQPPPAVFKLLHINFTHKVLWPTTKLHPPTQHNGPENQTKPIRNPRDLGDPIAFNLISCACDSLSRSSVGSYGCSLPLAGCHCQVPCFSWNALLFMRRLLYGFPYKFSFCLSSFFLGCFSLSGRGQLMR